MIVFFRYEDACEPRAEGEIHVSRSCRYSLLIPLFCVTSGESLPGVICQRIHARFLCRWQFLVMIFYRLKDTPLRQQNKRVAGLCLAYSVDQLHEGYLAVINTIDLVPPISAFYPAVGRREVWLCQEHWTKGLLPLSLLLLSVILLVSTAAVWVTETFFVGILGVAACLWLGIWGGYFGFLGARRYCDNETALQIRKPPLHLIRSSHLPLAGSAMAGTGCTHSRNGVVFIADLLVPSLALLLYWSYWRFAVWHWTFTCMVGHFYSRQVSYLANNMPEAIPSPLVVICCIGC